LKKVSCLVIILLFCLPSILPVVHSIYVEKSTDILENILDNGLMDSAWPMFQHDNKHTGRSSYGVLGNACVVKWTFNLSGSHSSPVIDKNGILYIGGKTNLGPSTLFAINPDGSLKWSFYTGGSVTSTPALGSDGTIYVGSHEPSGCLYAISSDGIEKWRFSVNVSTEMESIISSPAIGNDGTIYFGATNGNIYALNPDGSKKWHYNTETRVISSPAIDENGNVYIGSEDKCLYALKSNGSLIWKYQTGGGIKSSPVVGEDGTIYFGSSDSCLYALYPNGTLKWKFETGHWVDNSPAIDLDGNICLVPNIKGVFYSISPDGVENWRFNTSNESSVSPPVIDKFGIIYFGTSHGKLYALNPDGSIRWIWSYIPGYRNFIGASAIGEDGTIYIWYDIYDSYDSTFDFYLYTLNIVENDNPNKPTIEGPLNGYIDSVYFYVANCIDIDNDNISYFFDWDDGTNSGWTSFVSSGTSVNISHIWSDRGFYNVKVKVKDIWGHESEWASIEVSIPKNKAINTMFFLQRFNQFFPFFEKILNQII
jgi:outer membrane protein assembly factor BamB